ncbi:MAG: hypothetical protein CMB61_01855 [Euryarchaeota archaeon]|nr:hypothetical protein [Euryarchaeota archaeon]
MEWRRIDVEIDDSIESDDSDMVGSKMGFETNAESMHSEFLSGLTHLSEVQESHYNVIAEIESGIQRTIVKPLDDFVAEYGAKLSELEIIIPFRSTNLSGISMEAKDDVEGQIVRIIESERFGGLIKSFRLPPRREVVGAEIEGEFLSIKLDDYSSGSI